MANTAKGYPYPVGTDRVMDGDNAIRALAEKVDASVPYATATGIAAITGTATVQATAAVTFPVGRFSAPPVAVTSCTGHATYMATGTGVSATGFTAAVRQVDGTSGSISTTVAWQALQMLVGAGPGTQEGGPEPLELTVTCHTEGCGNAGAAIVLGVDPEFPPDTVMCGVCGQEITDVDPPMADTKPATE